MNQHPSLGFAQAFLRQHEFPVGIAQDTLVLTCDGLLPVQYLMVGDRVITRSGARRLQSLRVGHQQEIEMIRIQSAALTGGPSADLLVCPDQSVVLRDWRAMALTGERLACVAAHQLIDHEFIRRERVSGIRLFSLRFAHEEVIYANGLELACPAPLPRI